MYGRLRHGNREISATAPGAVPGAASGRPEVVADDERDGEVSPSALAKAPDPLIVPAKPANKAAQAAAESAEGSGGTKRNADRQSTNRTQGREAVAQARIRGAVSRNRKEKLTALLHHVSIEVLEWAFFSLKKRAAPGVDGRTWDQYATDLEANLADLHARVHAGTYRALPSRRKYIPKAEGRQRPLGIAAIEDKIVQAAVVALLTPIYEAEFLGFSYGFRPGRSQHDALDALAYGIKARKVNWILDADIRSFFDHACWYPLQQPAELGNW